LTKIWTSARILLKELIGPINVFLLIGPKRIYKVQKRATKMIPEFQKKIHYPDRLKQLNMSTLTYRRSSGDMIETYKLFTGKYDQQVALALPKNVTGKYFTRGNSNKLLVK